MKNLNILNVSFETLDFSNNKQEAVCYGYDESSNGGIFTCSHNLIVTKYCNNGEIKWQKDISDVVSRENSPVNITYLNLTNVICLGMANGEILTINDNGNDCSIAGLCDSGLQAMEWSPDQDSVVLVTKDLKMILMHCTFYPVHEVPLINEDFGEKQFITVGWGKKETQFHGSEGKQAAMVKVNVDAVTSISQDIIKISWRNDCQLYAVGFTMEGVRRFKVFDKDGLLQYTSEKQPGLEANLSWRPSGNVIATTQKLPDRYSIAFFEKNGLKHGGFDIPVDATTTIEDICWSNDSEIIALQCLDSISNTQNILLYTTCNYHWYLKQTIAFKSDEMINKILWDNAFDVANNKKLHIVMEDGSHLSYTWVWNIGNSRGKGDEDDAVVAVIDGTKILLTGFRQTVVPPPMAALELDVGSNVNSVHFYQGESKEIDFDSNAFCVITEDSRMIFYKQTHKFPLNYEAFFVGNINVYEIPFERYNWQWIGYDTVTCVQYEDSTYKFMEINIDFKEKSNVCNVKHSIVLPESVMSYQLHPTDTSKLYIHLNNGEILEYNNGDIDPLDICLPTACPRFSVLEVSGELLFLGLSHKGNFYYNDLLIIKNVSSYFIHTHFLLLTTLQHVLLCTEITKVGIQAIVEYQKTENPHVYKRKIERSAKLVIAVPNDTRTIFQMPRGNLEIIQPRPLSLKIIGRYLDMLKFNEAFDLMRKQRINLNLIYDHNPAKFLQSIDLFLENVKNISWLNLFLSDLENLDVTKTMYSSSYAERNTTSKEYDSNKVIKICDVIRECLVKRPDMEAKILPLLTTFVKKNTIVDLEQALTIIKELKSRESGGSKLPVGSDEALKYLLYMVDVSNLFDVALGMYDFDLVLLVASKSQKDPKEYVPLLNEFNGMEENFKRFSVNKHLKRFDRAVDCLAECGPEKHDELRNFVKYHSLYRKALELFSPSDEIYKQISEDYGLYLKLKKHFVEAGVVYRRAEKFDKAIECFKEAIEWEMALDLAHTWPREQFNELSRDLVNSLKDEKRHKEALIILEQFCDNQEETIVYAIENGQYKTALRLCSRCNRIDLRDNRLLPAILDECNNLNELIIANENTFLKHKNRLQVVREIKDTQPVDNYDSGYANRDSDLYSDAGSTVASSASRSSGRTFRSSKNRRKHERKLASLKEGSQYEDVALVMALHTLVTSTFDLRLQVREVNVALINFGKDNEAVGLQMKLERLLKGMKESFKEIWSNEFILEATNATIATQNLPEGVNIIPQGIATLEPHIRISPVIQEINWKLDGMQ